MKNFLTQTSLISLFMFTIVSCQSDTKVAGVNNTTDTAGLAEFNAMKQQKMIDSIAAESELSKNSDEEKSGDKKNPDAPSKSTASEPAQKSTSVNTDSENQAKEKKGWSKTAKGAVIGGVVGAGTGAVVNKKNRAAGAVVGGVVGAGAGAVIGNEMDKKDGRH